MLRTGMVLAGRYRLEQRAGSGGMGEVWRAFDGVLNRTVAIKCLLDAPPDEPSFVDQFRAEARIMATISHPGVVEVYDFGNDPAAGVYLVMKYIDGESLAHTLARTGRLGIEATLRLLADAAEALHAAHQRGVTHRDIKPGNLLLRRDGSVLVTDFGIARSAGATGHTTTGSLVGTAGYIAPERANGHPATPASDIYSLGVVAYRCLTGSLPFGGDSVVEIALRHVHDAPPPLPAEVPSVVRAIVERAMAKNPADRWPSGAALAVAARRALDPDSTQRPLDVVAAQQEDTAAVATRSPRRRLLLVAAAAVAAVVAGIYFLNAPSTPQAESLAESPAPNASAPADPIVANSLAASPGTPKPAPSTTMSGSVPQPTTGAASPKPGSGTGPLTAPAKLTATPLNATTIRLRWVDKSTREDGFTVIDGATSHNVSAGKTTFDWTGLAPDTRSCFKVRAYNASGVSAYFPAAQADWVCATTSAGTGPAAPTGLTATPIDSASIRLQWTDASRNEDGFTVTNGSASRNAGADATSLTWDGLSPGTYMCFKVRAYNASGVSAYSPPGPSDWVCVTTPA